MDLAGIYTTFHPKTTKKLQTSMGGAERQGSAMLQLPEKGWLSGLPAHTWHTHLHTHDLGCLRLRVTAA